jgi:hypothetical protein
MPQQFDLILTNRWKSAVLVLAIAGTSIPLMVGALEVFFNYNHLLGVFAILLWGAAVVFLPERIAKRVSSQATTVIIDDSGITVQDGVTGAGRRIDFADMTSYSTGVNYDFTIRPRAGKYLQLHLNTKLHPQGLGPLLDMQQHFNWAVVDYQRQYPSQPVIPDLGFFGRWAAVFWLCFLAFLMVWLGWRAFQPLADEGIWGGFLLSILGFALYTLLWWHHRTEPYRVHSRAIR